MGKTGAMNVAGSNALDGVGCILGFDFDDIPEPLERLGSTGSVVQSTQVPGSAMVIVL
jgi:hypothetical protein